MFVVLIFLFFGFVFSEEKVVAVIDGESITLEQFNKSFSAYWQEILHLPIHKATKEDRVEFLKWLVRSKIVEKEARKLGIEVSEEEIREYIRLNIGKDKLSDPVKRMVRTEILINKIVDRISGDISISDGEVEAYYYLNLRDFKYPKQVQILRVLVYDKEKAFKVYRLLKEGKDIEEEEDVRIGKPRWYSIQTLPSVLRKRLYPYNIGKVSKPLKLESGYIIVKIVDKKKEGVLDLKEAKPKVIRKLFNFKKEEVFRRWFSEVLKNYSIRLYFQYL